MKFAYLRFILLAETHYYLKKKKVTTVKTLVKIYEYEVSFEQEKIIISIM